MRTHEEKYDELLRKREAAREPAGAEATEKQHERGKRTARERVDALVDEARSSSSTGSSFTAPTRSGFDEKEFLGDGVVTGRATIDGRQVFLFSQDFTVLGGSLGEVFAEKICKVMDLALRTGSPMIGINDSGGARIQEGVVSLGGYAEIFWRNVQASGVIPQISSDRRSVRRRRRLLAGDHRLHHHDRADLADVHHRSRDHQDGHRRGRDVRTTRRRDDARHQERRRASDRCRRRRDGRA